jgi:hypothetical protein
MEIEVGKVYVVSAYNKKSLWEIEGFSKDDSKISTELLWRNGSFFVKVANEDEAEMLEECFENEDSVWESDDFEMVELDSTFDGQTEDFVFLDETYTEQEQQQFREDYDTWVEEENEGFAGRYDYLCGLGYDSYMCVWNIHGGICVEEVADDYDPWKE